MKQIITRFLSKIIRTNIGVEEKQGIIANAFQTVSSNGFVNGLLLVSLIVAYGIALQIAISGILRLVYFPLTQKETVSLIQYGLLT